jgi:hypothetical protein
MTQNLDGASGDAMKSDDAFGNGYALFASPVI